MNLIALQNWLDNASFAVLFVTMLVYWGGAAFPNLPATAVGTAGMAIANLCIANPTRGKMAGGWVFSFK
jgi:ABC-type transport system involved in cytochrome c biogenesis permease subunit